MTPEQIVDGIIGDSIGYHDGVKHIRKLANGSERKVKRLVAAEHVCRSFRKAISYHATQDQYMRMALDWLMVWIDNAPGKVKFPEPTPCPRRKRAS